MNSTLPSFTINRTSDILSNPTLYCNTRLFSEKNKLECFKGKGVKIGNSF
jgi:hypothetical protein